jgi:hypothetical protein
MQQKSLMMCAKRTLAGRRQSAQAFEPSNSVAVVISEDGGSNHSPSRSKAPPELPSASGALL